MAPDCPAASASVWQSRALLKQPNLLILDEAVSGLDEAAVDLVATTVNRLRGKVSVFFTAHKLPASLKVDRHLVLGSKGWLLLVESDPRHLFLTVLGHQSALRRPRGRLSQYRLRGLAPLALRRRATCRGDTRTAVKSRYWKPTAGPAGLIHCTCYKSVSTEE